MSNKSLQGFLAHQRRQLGHRCEAASGVGTLQDAVKPGDWELHVWSEVPLDCLRQLKKEIHAGCGTLQNTVIDYWTSQVLRRICMLVPEADEARKKELDEQKKESLAFVSTGILSISLERDTHHKSMIILCERTSIFGIGLPARKKKGKKNTKKKKMTSAKKCLGQHKIDIGHPDEWVSAF